MTIKISEIFHSIQGEGLYVGHPSIFIRTFGCNFRCKGFGVPEGVAFPDEADIIALDYKDHPEWTLKDLPLTSTGCDSYFSVFPAFKSLSPAMDIDDIVYLVEKERRKNQRAGPKNGPKNSHIVITGGEPLLGWQKQYPALLDKLAEEGYRYITFETNGTQELNSEFEDWLLLNHISGPRLNITFSVSPKLPPSGERIEVACNPAVISSYMKYGEVYLKFVVAEADDINHVQTFVSLYKGNGFYGDVYLMPAGGDPETYHKNAVDIAELAMFHGYIYSPRLQVDLFKNIQGT